MKNNSLHKNLLWLSVALGMSITGAFAQQNRDEVPKGQFLSARTRAHSYVKTADVYSADAPKLAEEWTGNGFSLQTVSGSAAFATGQYAPSAQLSAVSVAIRLPDAAGKERLVLQLDEMFKTETAYDRMLVEVSDNGGKTWQLVSRASGSSSGWRSRHVNITAFAGKTVAIRLSLTSDASVEGDGWSITGVSVYKALLAKPEAKKSKMLRSVNASQVASIEIINVHTEDYPEAVFVDFLAKNSLGAVVPELDRSDFKIWNGGSEDGTSCKELYHANHALRPAVDIVFLMDNSGSMSDDQENVADNLENMIDTLNLAGYDTRLALVRFGQDANGTTPGTVTSGSPIVEPNPSLPNTAFFYNTNDFINFWYAKNVDDGWYEPGYWAMEAAANSPLIQFRDYAEKIFLIITDEDISSRGSENASHISMSDAISALNTKEIRQFAITENTSAFIAEYKPVCDSTKGDFYPNIKSNFGSIFANLAGNISSKYTLRFCPPAGTVQDPIDPTYCIPLVLKAANDPTVEDATCYTPKPSPRIVRSASTRAMDGAKQDEGKAITLSVEILDVDPDSIKGVKVYWRKIGDTSVLKTGSFARDSMSNDGGATFNYDISAGKVLRHSIEYYFVAQCAGGIEVKSPAETQGYFAWTVPIAPNYAPYIRNVVAPTESYPCQDISIAATITDNTDNLRKTMIFYKTVKAPSVWAQVPMTAPSSDDPDDFVATIPANAMQTTGVYYYIYAEDNYGIQDWYGTPEEPKIITPIQSLMADSGANMLVIAANTNDITTACSSLGGDDEVKAYFMNSCGQLQEGGSAIIYSGTSNGLVTLYTNSSTTYKNGFDSGEKIHFRLIREGVAYDLSVNPDMSFVPNGLSLFQSATGTGEPQIEVTGRGVAIAPNDLTPGLSDNTDFDEQINPTAHTFIINNTGCDNLEVSSIAVSDTANFSVANVQQPISIYPDGSHSFTVTYKAKATATVIVSIINNSINPFNFGVAGTKPTINVNDCNISLYPNPMTSSDYGGFVAFDVLIESNVRVYVVTSLGAFRRLILDHTTLPVDRHTYYFSKSGVGGAGTYLMVVEIDNNPYTSVFVVQ